MKTPKGIQEWYNRVQGNIETLEKMLKQDRDQIELGNIRDDLKELKIIRRTLNAILEGSD